MLSRASQLPVKRASRWLWTGFIAIILLAGCGNGDKAVDPAAVKELQAILAYETDKRILDLLDANPGLLQARLNSPSVAEVSVLGYAAVHRPNFETIFPQLLERGANPSTAVEPAAIHGKWIELQKLLAAGADANAGDALVTAASRGHTRVVLLLLDAGADPNHRASKGGLMGDAEPTALHMGALRGDLDMLQGLVAAGGDVNILDGYGTPPLAEAASGQQVGTILFLIDNGADPGLLDYDTARSLGRLAYQRNLTQVLKRMEESSSQLSR